MDKRLKLIITITIAVFALVILFTILFPIRRQPSAHSESFSKDITVPKTFQTVAGYGPDSLVFSNGRSLVSYNYTSGQTTLLSPDDTISSLDNVDQISVTPDKHYVIFHTLTINAGGSLDAILKQQGQDTNKPFWWIYDLQSKTFVHFAQTATEVHVQGNQAYTQEKDTVNSVVRLVTYTLPDLKPVKSIIIPECIAFFVTPDHFLLQTNQDTVLSTKDGVVNNQILSGTKLLNVSSDGNSAVGLYANADTGAHDLTHYDLLNSARNLLAQDVGSYIVSSDQNTILYNLKTETVPQSYTYNVLTSTKQVLAFNKKSTLASSAQLAAVVNDSTAVFRDGLDQVHLAGKVLAPIQDLSNLVDNTITLQVGDNTIDLNYFFAESAFIITLHSNAIDAEKKAVYDQLHKQGLNPDLLDIRFAPSPPPPPTLD